MITTYTAQTHEHGEKAGDEDKKGGGMGKIVMR